MQTFQLQNGDTIPVLGFGTWKLADGEEAYSAVQTALRFGYRLIDTAALYNNEASVGRAIRESDVPREEVFVTTKLREADHAYDDALAACRVSMERLGLAYIDLYLIHWPTSAKRLEAWKALVDLRRQGLVKHIGVSNYTVAHLNELLDASTVVPEVNQIEFHPLVYKQQQEDVVYCQENNILVEAYSPFAQGKALSHPTLQQIAEKYNKTVAQVLLRWSIQHRTIPLPKSSTTERIKQNLAVFDFELSIEEMNAMNDLGDDGTRVTSDPHVIP